VLAILAVLFYVLGVGALIDLTGYGQWFGWKSQFYLAVAGACLSVVPGILLYLVRPPPAPEKKAGPGGEKGRIGGKEAPAKPGERPAGAPARDAVPNAPSSTNKVNR